MSCPICNTKLVERDGGYVCPNAKNHKSSSKEKVVREAQVYKHKCPICDAEVLVIDAGPVVCENKHQFVINRTLLGRA